MDVGKSGNLVNIIENLANKANVGKIQKQRDDGINQKTSSSQNNQKYGGAIKRMAQCWCDVIHQKFFCIASIFFYIISQKNIAVILKEIAKISQKISQSKTSVFCLFFPI